MQAQQKRSALEFLELAQNQSPTNIVAADTALKTDSFIHEAALFESWRALTLLSTENNDAIVVNQRFTRLALNKENVANSESAWRYQYLQQLGFSLSTFAAMEDVADNSNATMPFSDASESLLAREALGLSGVSIDNARVWNGAFELRQLRSVETSDSNAGCHDEVLLESPPLSLQLNDFQCDDTQAIGPLFYKNHYAAQVVGQLKPSMRNVRGIAWVEQVWGASLELPGGAVYLDNAWLLLDQNSPLRITRSRRKSGRGPVISTAVLGGGDSAVATSFNISFDTGSQQLTKQGEFDFSNWRIRSESPRINLYVSAAKRIENDLDFNRALIAVRLSGTHEGVGLVEFALPTVTNDMKKTNG